MPVRLKSSSRKAEIDSKLRLFRFQSRKFGYQMDAYRNCALFSYSAISRSACGKRSGCSSTPLTTEKSAVFAPMPSAVL